MTIPPSLMSPAVAAERLLAWYHANRRTMPWREDPTPYHILLSELLCQQTRIDTAIPYFERFVARWPTVADLAAADVEEVLHLWAGLGYYSRARNLHRAAQAAVSMGGIPGTPEALLELPGIGPYTAGAIASIAFGVKTPAVDGNVERVISRLDARGEDPRSPSGRRAIEARVQAMHADAPPASHAGDLTQALMELGATVCSPRSPSCAGCPWTEGCAARASGDPTTFPVVKKKAPPKPMSAVAGVLAGPHGVLMGRRPPGLLGGLWEPIRCDVDGDDEIACIEQGFAEMTGLRVRVARRLGALVHVFSHRRLALTVFAVEANATATPTARAFYEELRWLDPEAPGVGLSTLARKVLTLAASAEATEQLSLLAADSKTGR
jgi:A/G-specific adenine glycosylase